MTKLHICNGDFKSGSTWLLNVVRRIVDADDIPMELQRDGWSNTSIEIGSIGELLAAYPNSSFLSKSHYRQPDERDRILSFKDDVRVYTMTRSPGDVIVSAFHHFIRVGNLSESTEFDEFFWRDRGPSAQSVVRNLMRYESTWSAAPADLVFRTTYEKFHANSGAEIQRLGSFCDVELTLAEVSKIAETTSFSNWKSATGTPHLRKGLVGESLSVLTNEMTAQLDAWLSAAVE